MKGRENSRTYKLRQEIKPEYLNLFYKRKIILNLKKFIQIMNLLKNLYLIVLKKIYRQAFLLIITGHHLLIKVDYILG